MGSQPSREGKPQGLNSRVDSRVPRPELIAGPRQGMAWDVRYCPAAKSLMGLAPKAQVLRVPERLLREDWLVQQHELTHVADYADGWPFPKEKLARRFHLMLCEVAIESISLYRNGIDIRQARDHLDWAHWSLPKAEDMVGCALLWLQLTFSADTARHPGIPVIYRSMTANLGDERVAWLCQARDAVILDPRGIVRRTWAAWLAECFRADEASRSGSGTGAGTGTPSPGSEGEDGEGESAESDDSPSDDASSEDAGNGSEAGDADTDDGTTGDGADESDSTASDAGDDAGDESDPGDDAGDTGDSASDDASDGDDTVDELDEDDASPLENLGERPQAEQARRNAEAEERAGAERAQAAMLEAYAFDPNAPKASYGREGARIDICRAHTFDRVAERSPGRGSIRAALDGSALKFPERLYRDGKVMMRVGRQGGGWLVDGSGSMCWDQDSAAEACALFPGLWVGWYSWHMLAYKASGRGLPDTPEEWRKARTAQYWARLCIIAERGRVGVYNPRDTDETRAHSGGNMCDYEVLEYFARATKGVRLWISDGMVFGEPDHGQRCNAVMRQHNIVRVESVKDALAYMRGDTRVPHWHTVAMGR